MRKYSLFLLCLFFSSFLLAERLLDEKKEPVFVQDNFAYFAFNLTPIPWPAPGFSVGIRGGYPNFRLDLDLELFLFMKKALLRTTLKGLWYFNPESRHAFYTGLGFSPGLLNSFYELHPRYISSANVYFGDQMSLSRNTTYFLQIEADFNTNFRNPSCMLRKPVMYVLSLGKSF